MFIRNSAASFVLTFQTRDKGSFRSICQNPLAVNPKHNLKLLHVCFESCRFSLVLDEVNSKPFTSN